MSAEPGNLAARGMGGDPSFNCWTCRHNIPGGPTPGMYTCARLVPWRVAPLIPLDGPPAIVAVYDWEGRQSWDAQKMPPRETEPCSEWEAR